MRRLMVLLALAAAVVLPVAAMAETQIGRVDTTTRLGPNDRIEVTRYDDPRVPNVSCYVSRAVTGGFGSWIGVTEDPSRFSIACRAVGPVTMPTNLPRNEQVFDERASLFFKTIRVHRMVDPQKNVLVYLITSTRLIDGSPFNSVTAVPVSPNP